MTNVLPKAKTLSNQQKYFVNTFTKELSKEGREYNLRNIQNDVWYLSRTFDVKFFKWMSWISPRVILNAYDFGRFKIMINKIAHVSYITRLKSSKHKHPHTYSSNFHPNKPSITCMGGHVDHAILAGDLWSAYKMANIVLPHVSDDAQITSKFYGPKEELYNFCYNFAAKNYQKCNRCREGYIYKDNCTYYDCEDCPYDKYGYLKIDDGFDDYGFDDE